MELIFEREHKLRFRSNSHVCRELNNMSLMSQQQQTPSPVLTSGQTATGHSQVTITDSDPESTKPVPLSPISSEGQLRGILKKSSSPTLPNHQHQGEHLQIDRSTHGLNYTDNSSGSAVHDFRSGSGQHIHMDLNSTATSNDTTSTFSSISTHSINNGTENDKSVSTAK